MLEQPQISFKNSLRRTIRSVPVFKFIFLFAPRFQTYHSYVHDSKAPIDTLKGVAPRKS